jgi:electron-transferring-flavoprotein dehydrogenase
MSQRESMEYDVVIVGAGVAGLAAAIRLKQLAGENGREISVCVLEKGSEVGAHILSGAVIDPKAIEELLPNWRDLDSPLTVPVTDNLHWVLTRKRHWAIPQFLVPPLMHNEGKYTASLGNVTRWLGGQAEALGVEIFPAFRRRRCCSTTMAPSWASRPATWAWPGTARTSPITSQEWSFMPATHSSPRALAVT